MTAYPQAARDAFYPQEQTDTTACLLLVEHVQLGAPLRFTDLQGPYDLTDKVYKLTVSGNDWLWAPFSLQRPGEGPDPSPSAKLRVPDLDKIISRALDFADTPFKLTMTFVLKSDPTQQIGDPIGGAEWRNIHGMPGTNTIEGDLVWRDSETSPWPADRTRIDENRAMAMALE